MGIMKLIKRWLLNMLLALDTSINALIGGDPFETISSRAGKSDRKWACVLCKFLDWLDKDHCKKAILSTAGADALQNQK